jgi:hypothetical protein
MSVSDFVAAAEKADASLKGSSEKDQQAIQKLSSETEGLAKDTTVSHLTTGFRTQVFANGG